MGKLILTRSRDPFPSLSPFQIVIDGRPLASVGRGRTAVIDLPDGHHEVIARCDWCRSNPLEIEVGPQGNNHAEVGSVVVWWYSLLVLFCWCGHIGWQNIILGLLFLVLFLAPFIILAALFYLRKITASEAAARRGMRIPHPDALPAIRLSPEVFGKS